MATPRVPFRGFCALGVVAAAAIATCLPLLPTPAAHADVSPSPSASDSSAPYGQTELAQAAQTNTPTIVASLTTPTSQVTAEPDGTFQLDSSDTPVRAMTSSGWQAINTTLATTANGSLSPQVTTAPTTFSGGGNTLLSSEGTPTLGVSTYWPTALPTPTVSGSSVTYPNVRPNVDLVMTANSTGFNESLVVKTAAAAAAINANPVVLTAVGHGVSIVQRTSGSIVGVDPSGNEDFSAPAPAAWDSSTAANAPTDRPDATQSANGNVAPMGQISKPTSNGAQITLTVPNSLLNSPSTVYPIYVDPDISSEAGAHFMTVESNGWTSFNDSSQPLRVGYCDYAHCISTSGIANSYMQFQTDPLANQPTTANVISADVYAYEIWNASSAATPVNLDQSGSFNSGTTYPGPAGSTLETQSKSCGWNNANYCYFDFGSQNVTNYVQSIANAKSWNIFFALTSPDNGNTAYWKKFSDSGSTTVKLSVRYNYPPSKATTPTISGSISCPGQPIYAAANPVKISSSAYAYGGDASIGMDFEILTHPLSNNTPAIHPATPIVAASHAQATWSPNLNNGVYSVYAQAQSESGYSPEAQGQASDYLNFTVDTSKPAAPTVSSKTYPDSYWGATDTAGDPGSFTLVANDSTTVGFTWAIDTGAPASLPSTQCGAAYNSNINPTSGTLAATNGQATLGPATAANNNIGFGVGVLNPGYHYLTVRAFTNAHNLSSTSTTYKFYVTRDTTTDKSVVTLVEAENLPVAINPTDPVNNTFAYTQNQSSDSGGADSELVSNAPASFTYTLSPASTGYYAIGAQVLTGTHNARLTFQVNDKAAVDTSNNPISYDTCGAVGTHFVPLGGFQLNVGTDPTTGQPYVNKLTVSMTLTTCAGATYPTAPYDQPNTTPPTGYPPSSFNDKGYSAGIDDLILASLQPSSYASLQAAFNNHGIGIDNQNTGASFDQTNDTTPGTDGRNGPNALSAGATGLTPGSTYSIGGETFTIPPTGPNGNDNVIAAGQTITLNATAPNNYADPAGYVNFLVGSTCGTLQQGAGKEFTFNITYPPTPGGIAYPNATIQSNVPEWTSTANVTGQSGQDTVQITASKTALAYLNGDNGTPVQTPVTLYLMQVPIPQAYYNRTINSITLPDDRTDFTNTCDATNNALHIFAMNITTN